MNWKAHAERLAEQVAHPASRWHDAIASVPRHAFVPRWWIPADEGGRSPGRQRPASWLTALRPGGQLVTTITGTTLILTADKTDDGGAEGRIEWNRAGFMETRAGADYPPQPDQMFAAVRDAEGEQVSLGRYPVVDVAEAWELSSMLGVLAPGVECHFKQNGGTRIAWMLHSDGSWARVSGISGEAPQIQQSRPRRLWDILDDIRHTWLTDGSLPLYGARVRIDPDGTIHLRRGGGRRRSASSSTNGGLRHVIRPCAVPW